MNTTLELEKIAQIKKEKQFTFRGIVYQLDAEATEGLRDNEHLKRKPLLKLVGKNEAGQTITVWSHDCIVEGQGKPKKDWYKKDIYEYLNQKQEIFMDKKTLRKTKKDELLDMVE